jgi:endonuclease/exonuclease/phosphatase family metal-dependent hydrolase
MRLKVLSLNIACFISWNDKKDLLKRLVEDERPDILCLQEVARNLLEDTENYNQIHKIAQLLNTKRYHGNLCNPYIVDEVSRKHESCYHGCATFVLNPRIKIINYQDIPVNKQGSRLVILSELETPEGELDIINLHLDARTRREEANSVLKFIEQRKNSLILCGDLNSFDANNGTGDVDDLFRKSLADTWSTLHKGKAITYYGSNWWHINASDHPHTIKIKERNSSFPDGSLDYIFYKNAKAKSIKIAKDTIPKISDHMALAAEFEI